MRQNRFFNLFSLIWKTVFYFSYLFNLLKLFLANYIFKQFQKKGLGCYHNRIFLLK